MKKLALAAALSLTMVGVASAADHLLPGTPGDKNCVGQTMAYLAQGNDVPANGIGGVASFVGLSVKEVKAVVEALQPVRRSSRQAAD